MDQNATSYHKSASPVPNNSESNLTKKYRKQGIAVLRQDVVKTRHSDTTCISGSGGDNGATVDHIHANMSRQDSETYTKRKQYFSRMLTVYGRKPVLEALSEEAVQIEKLHLSTSNKAAEILTQIEQLARARGAEVEYHDRLALSRISKNAKQDQGVALDVLPSGFRELQTDTFQHYQAGDECIALDNITNPQNLGMIIRSVCASRLKALIIPRKGCAKLDPLVIKASAGTLFRAPILRCDTLESALEAAKSCGLSIVAMDLKASQTLSSLDPATKPVFVLGNESDGISDKTREYCDQHVRIAMFNKVESLNVAVTASLIALRHQL